MRIVRTTEIINLDIPPNIKDLALRHIVTCSENHYCSESRLYHLYWAQRCLIDYLALLEEDCDAVIKGEKNIMECRWVVKNEG